MNAARTNQPAMRGDEDRVVILDDLMAFLEDFMGDVGYKDPYMPNGLQVRGREEVKLLASGVSASLRLFEEAVAHWPVQGTPAIR